MLRPLKLATPFAAVPTSVPFNTVPVGFAAKLKVMLADELVTTLPKASSTLTATAGAMLAPAMTSEGCVVNPRIDGQLAVTSNGVLVALRAPLDAPSE